MRITKLLSLAAVVALSFPVALNGQVFEFRADVQEEQSDGAGGPQQMSIMSFSTSDGFNSSGPIMLMGDSTGGFSFGSDPFALLNNKDVRSELNIVDEQLDLYKEVQKNFRDRMSDVTEKLKSGNFDPSVIDELKEVSAEIRDRKKEELEGLLLPEQIERLKQIALQNRMKHSGTMGALSSEEVAEELGLTKDEVKELKEKAKELSEKVKAQIEEIREKARQSLIEELSAEQQEKLKAMIGDKFESKSEPMSFSIPNLPGRQRSNGGDRKDF